MIHRARPLREEGRGEKALSLRWKSEMEPQTTRMAAIARIPIEPA
jgi:hypothetical protein